ncbi:MAG: hypothetical protein JWO42_4035 [Chloroflexi bacterium]|jgi:hypothetical protein|nr:hypothetical protein [Chloroflexota bacterium]
MQPRPRQLRANTVDYGPAHQTWCAITTHSYPIPCSTERYPIANQSVVAYLCLHGYGPSTTLHIARNATLRGPLAQRLELPTHNRLVPGSNPGGPTPRPSCSERPERPRPSVWPALWLPPFGNIFLPIVAVRLYIRCRNCRQTGGRD